MPDIHLTEATVYRYMIGGPDADGSTYSIYNYIVDEDIDLSNLVDGDGNPIAFRGFPGLSAGDTVDGQGYTLSNWTYTDMAFTGSYLPEFGLWASAGDHFSIKNLIIDNFNITLGIASTSNWAPRISLLINQSRLDYGSIVGCTIKNSNLTITNTGNIRGLFVGLLSGRAQTNAVGEDISDNKVYNNTVDITWGSGSVYYSNVANVDGSIDPYDGIKSYYKNNVSIKNSVTIDNSNKNIYYSYCVGITDNYEGTRNESFSSLYNLYCDSGDDADTFSNTTSGAIINFTKGSSGYSQDALKQKSTYVDNRFNFVGEYPGTSWAMWTFADSTDGYPITNVPDDLVITYQNDTEFYYHDPDDTYTIKPYIQVDSIPYRVVDYEDIGNGILVTTDRAIDVAIGPILIANGAETVSDPDADTMVDRDINGRLAVWNNGGSVTSAAGDMGKYYIFSNSYVYKSVATDAFEDIYGLGTEAEGGASEATYGFWATFVDGSDTTVVPYAAAVTGPSVDVGRIKLKVEKGHGISTSNQITVLNGTGDLYDTVTTYQGSGSFYATVASYDGLYDLIQLDTDASNTAYITPYEQGEVTKIGLYATTLVSDMAHLAGETVDVTIDGVDQGTYTVSSDGRIALRAPAQRVTVGLPYVSKVITVPIDAPDRFNPFTDVIKKTAEVYVRYYRAQGGKLAFNDEDYVSIKAVYDKDDKKDTIVKPNTKHKFEQKLCVKQDSPYPFTLLMLIPNMR